MKKIEQILEGFLFRSRWLLAPFYVFLVLALVVLVVKGGQELIHLFERALRAEGSSTILDVLSLIDLTLTGSLIVIVVFSGYENFVSRIDESEHTDWPEWMGRIDFSGLKLKLMSSIVAISAVQLLRAFMNVGQISDRDLLWYVAIHMVFVVSGLILAFTDRVAGKQAH
jgi:uncharacterized protein (TIGR00645 family)